MQNWKKTYRIIIQMKKNNKPRRVWRWHVPVCVGRALFLSFFFPGVIINSVSLSSQKCLIWTINYLVIDNIRNKLPFFPKDKLDMFWVPNKSLEWSLRTSGCLSWPVVDTIPAHDIYGSFGRNYRDGFSKANLNTWFIFKSSLWASRKCWRPDLCRSELSNPESWNCWCHEVT